jgi:tripeptide aminopeptidase
MTSTRILLAALCSASLLPVSAAATDQSRAIGERLLQDPHVTAAIDIVRRHEATVIDEQVRLCEIPAPPFKEQARARTYRAAFEAHGLKDVRIDAVGNVIGVRPGRAARPNVVLSAHLDTVFPEGTDVGTSRNGPVIAGPGVGDDCRGLAVLLGVLHALNSAPVQTEGTVTFAGTVGEEGLGNLRGVKHLFDTELKGRVDSFISIDGAGLGITYSAVGSRRYRVTVKGPGGHSYGDFGIANPIHAIGRAIARVAAFPVRPGPKTTFNVGRIGGGTSVNSIAYEAWMEVDLRSEEESALAALDAQFLKAADGAVAQENERWGNRGMLFVEKTLVGDRPARQISPDAPIVRAAVSVTRALGLDAPLSTGSTDANYPMSLGIPSVTLDGGGRGQGSHSLQETFDTTDSWQGTARALLLVLALAGAGSSVVR